MPFQFTPYRSPLTDSIADRIGRGGDIEAQRARSIGNASADAAFQSGNAWAGAIRGIGDVVAGIPAQMAQQKRQGTVDQVNALKLNDAQRDASGRQAMAGIMRGDQLPAGDAGPRQESFLSADGLFDIAKITASLGKSGYGDMAGDLVKGAESINDSILKHQTTEAQLAKDHAVMIGDLADGALKMMSAGTPLVQAMDFVVQPALATKRLKPEEYEQVKQQIASLPPEQQQRALVGLMDQAARLGPTKTLSEGAQETDRYGRVVAKGGEKPKDFTLGEGQVRFDESGNPIAYGPDKAAPRRTENEQALDAFAKTIGKAKAEDLTDADLQKFEERKTSRAVGQAMKIHAGERAYDNANPAPAKATDQNKLEQEYRTVLTRAMSSRSGGIGAEDAKVQQANHLLGLLDQTYDAKTGTYNIPKVQQTELAMGLAKLIAPGGTVGIQMEKEINQRTAAGDLAGALTYITGTPMNATTQDIAQMFKDSIARQGTVAEQNREGEMAYLRGLAPTDLEEPRRQALEATSLNPLRQSRVIQNTKTGERRLQVSTDGGKTWK